MGGVMQVIGVGFVAVGLLTVTRYTRMSPAQVEDKLGSSRYSGDVLRKWMLALGYTMVALGVATLVIY
jgi:hypothetical protein